MTMLDVMKQKEQQQELHSKLWTIANDLRGKMEPYEFKDYILSIIFYRFLSEKLEMKTLEMLENDEFTYEEVWSKEELKPMKEILKKGMLNSLGYIIKPEHLFSNLVRLIDKKEFQITDLMVATKEIADSSKNTPSEHAFNGLFDNMKLDDNKLGRTNEERAILMGKVIKNISTLSFGYGDYKFDVLGSAYEYLIGMFAQSAGKKAGEFYSPTCFVEVLSQMSIAAKFNKKPNKDKKVTIQNVNDPTCGSGGLLLKIKEYANVQDRYYGTELTHTTYNLARMNMLLHEISYENFKIENADTLENPQYQNVKFDIQVANPPYSVNWSSDERFLEDERFAPFNKLAPKTKGDFAFVQHIVHSMKEDGVATVLLPHGVLFRGASEESIRKTLIEQFNVLDAVIGLPAGCFQGTDIPVVCLVLKKGRTNKDIFFIDASQDFEKGKNQNTLLPEHIDKIVDTYLAREDVEKYAHKAEFKEIKENEFNLNIPRYVDTFEEEEEIDLQEVKTQISTTKTEISKIEQELDVYFKELGI